MNVQSLDSFRDWSIEYCESTQLTTIDAFLVAYQNHCSITINAHLSEPQKQNHKERMLEYLIGVHDHTQLHMYAA